MNVSDELVRLIEAIVEKKINAQMLKVKNITSSGDLALTSMGNIYISAGSGKKAYYTGVEIGTGAGGVTSFNARTGAVSSIVGDYDAWFLKLSGGTMTGGISFNITGSGQVSAIILNAGSTFGVIEGFMENRDWDTQVLDGYGICKSDLVGSSGIFGGASKSFNLNSTMDATIGKIILPNSANVPANCVEAEIYWESDADKLWIGSGTNTRVDFWPRGVAGKIWLDEAHLVWLIVNGSDVELHMPVGYAWTIVTY